MPWRQCKNAVEAKWKFGAHVPIIDKWLIISGFRKTFKNRLFPVSSPIEEFRVSFRGEICINSLQMKRNLLACKTNKAGFISLNRNFVVSLRA